MTRFWKRLNLRMAMKYIMTPGMMQNRNPRIVNMSMNHGIGGIPWNVTTRPDWVVALHFSVEKN